MCACAVSWFPASLNSLPGSIPCRDRLPSQIHDSRFPIKKLLFSALSVYSVYSLSSLSLLCLLCVLLLVRIKQSTPIASSFFLFICPYSRAQQSTAHHSTGFYHISLPSYLSHIQTEYGRFLAPPPPHHRLSLPIHNPYLPSNSSRKLRTWEGPSPSSSSSTSLRLLSLRLFVSSSPRLCTSIYRTHHYPIAFAGNPTANLSLPSGFCHTLPIAHPLTPPNNEIFFTGIIAIYISFDILGNYLSCKTNKEPRTQ